MASAASATFRLTQPSQSHSLKSKPHFTFFPFKPFTFSPLHKHPKLQIAAKSTKEDIPPASEQESPTEPVVETDAFDKRRLEEKFAVLNTGIYECRSCGYLYNEAAGDPSYPIAPGLPLDRVPDDWRCPTCGAAKSFFASKSVEIAGFAQNQQFGLGGNTLTSGQKAILIYESEKHTSASLYGDVKYKTDIMVARAITRRNSRLLPYTQLDDNEDSSI